MVLDTLTIEKELEFIPDYPSFQDAAKDDVL